MKNFFENLAGLFGIVLFALFPAIVIGILGFILDRLGLLGAALSIYDLFRLLVIIYFGISIVRIILGKK